MKIYLKTIGSLIITTVIIITSLLQVMANPVSKSESMEKLI